MSRTIITSVKLEDNKAHEKRQGQERQESWKATGKDRMETGQKRESVYQYHPDGFKVKLKGRNENHRDVFTVLHIIVIRSESDTLPVLLVQIAF